MLNKNSDKSVPPFSLALVTGASSGIGQALCHLLAQKGIPLLISGRNSERLKALALELKDLVPVDICIADLAKSEECLHLVQKIRHSVPDLIINNAGFGLYGEALTKSTEEQLEIVEVNAKAVLHLTLEGAKAMLKSKKSGVILNVSSAASFLLFPGLAVYAATKTYVTQLSQSLDYEMQPQGIRVLAACPGMVDTAFRRRAGGIQEAHQLSMSADFAANQIWQQIEKRQTVNIFDWKTRWSIYLTRLLPKAWTSRFLAARIRSFHPTQAKQ